MKNRLSIEHRTIMLLVATLFMLTFSVAGQANYAYSFELNSTNLINLTWSSDSKKISYYNAANFDETASTDALVSVSLSQPLWEEVNIQAGNISQTSIWSLQPNLTSAQVLVFNPLDFIYVSSSGNLLAYAHNVPISEFAQGYPLTLGDMSTNAISETSFTMRTNSSPEYFNIFWSESETALAIRDFAIDGSPVFKYVNIQQGINNLTEHRFREIQNARYAPVDPSVDTLYDISDDGNSVLLTARPLGTNDIFTAPSHLIVWKPSETQNSQIITTFGSSLSAASFSPDGKWLAILDDTQLHIIDILNALPAPVAP